MLKKSMTAKNTLLIITIMVSLGVSADSDKLHPVDMLVNNMYTNSPEIKSQSFKEEEAWHAYNDSLWQRYPTPSFSVEQNTDNKFDSRFTLTQPLWTGGNITNTIGFQKSLMEAEGAEKNVIKMDGAYALINELGEWISSHQKYQSYNKASNIYSDLEITIRRRVEAGAAPDVDILLMETRSRVLRNDISKEQNDFLVSTQKISSLVGRMISTQELVELGFSEPKSIMPYGDIPNMESLASMINFHPRIISLQKEINSKEYEYKKERSAVWPTLSIQLRHDQKSGDEFQSSDTGVFINVTSNWSAGLSSLTRHNKVESSLLSVQSEKDAELQRLYRNYINDLMQYEITIEQIANIEESISAANSVYDSYKRQYLVGSKTWIELLNSVQDIIRYEVEKAELISALFITSWRLHILQNQGKYL